MSQTIQIRQTNPEESEKKGSFESPMEEAICNSYVERSIADQLGEFATINIMQEHEDVTAERQRTTSNYHVFDTVGGFVSGLYVSHAVLSEIFDREVSEDDPVDSIGFTFGSSTEEAWEEALSELQDEQEEEEADAENEAAALLAEADDDSDDEEEAEPEVSDEELALLEE